MSVKSFSDIHKLKLKRDEVQLTKAGGHFKARFNGDANFVFGSTAQEARDRLLNTPSRTLRNKRRNSEVRERNLAMGFREVETA
jgi:hypothetical protein